MSTDYVYDDPERLQADRAVRELQGKDFDLLILCIAGWIPTYTIVQVADMFKEKPMLLWGLGGYYKDGILFTTADNAGTSIARKVFEDMGYQFKYIYNTPESFCDTEKIRSYLIATKTRNLLRSSRIGIMGFRDMKLYSTLYDGVSLRSKIGVEVEFFEMFEIFQRMERLNKDKINETVKKVRKKYSFKSPIEDRYIEKPIKLYLALKEKINEEKYKGVSLNDVDGVKKLFNFLPTLTFMLLADELGICSIPETDVLGSVTQLITKNLTGQIGAYLEIYEFFEDRILFGVPDYVPSEIVEGDTEIMLNNFGLQDIGLLNISKLKTGTVTMARLVQSGDKYSIHVVTGEAVEPRRWSELGWDKVVQLPGLEVIINDSLNSFTEKVSSQHYVFSYGDNISLFRDYCKLCNIEMII